MTSETVSREEFDALKKEFESLKMGKTVKKEKVKRAPSAYNLYMGKTMKKLRVDNPTMDHKDIFKKAVESWQKDKAKK